LVLVWYKYIPVDEFDEDMRDKRLSHFSSHRLWPLTVL